MSYNTDLETTKTRQENSTSTTSNTFEKHFLTDIPNML